MIGMVVVAAVVQVVVALVSFPNNGDSPFNLADVEDLLPRGMQQNVPVECKDTKPYKSCVKRDKAPFPPEKKKELKAKSANGEMSVTARKLENIDEYIKDSKESDGKEALVVDGVAAERGEYPWSVQLGVSICLLIHIP